MARILLVEDDQADLLLIRQHLEGLEAEWHSVGDLQALKRALEKGPYDVMLLSLGPRPEDGLEELRVMRAYAPDTPLVMLVPPRLEPLAMAVAKPDLDEFVVKRKGKLPGLRAAVEKALERKHRRDLFEAVPVGLYRSTPEGRILEANPALCAMLGYSREELLGLDARALYLEAEEREAAVAHLETTPLVVAQRLRLQRKDGEVLWVEEHAHAVRDSQGQVLYLEGSLVDISERTRLEERFRALVENTSDLIYLMDENGAMLYASPNVRQVLGYDPQGYLRERLSVLSFVHPEDRPYAEASLEDLVRHPGQTREYRLRILDASGEVRHARVWGRNLLHDPAVRGIVLNVRDVTEEDRLRLSLERERSRFKAIVEALSGVVFQVALLPGQPGRPVYVSPQAQTVLGHSPEALLENPALWWGNVHPEDQASLPKDAGAPGEVRVLRYRYRHGQSGAWVWIQEHRVADPEGQFLTGYAYDATKELEAQRALAEQEALFRTLSETAPALILLWQEEQLVFANREAERTTGYSLEELKSRPIWEFVHPLDREMVRARGQARLRGEAVESRYRFRIRTKSGETRWLDYSAARVDFGGRPAVLGVGFDVTEAQEHQLDLEAVVRLAEALRRSDELKVMLVAALDETLALLDTPVGSVLLYDPESHSLEEVASRGWLAPIPTPPVVQEESLTGWVLLHGVPYVSREFAADPKLRPAIRHLVPPGWGGVVLPLRAGSWRVGALTLAVAHPRELSARELKRLELIGEAIGNAVRRASLRRKLEARVGQLEALRAIDQAISASLDLRLALEVFCEQLMRLPLDAVSLLLYRKESRMLETIETRGFRSPPSEVRRLSVPLGQGHTGRAALERRPVGVDDLTRDPGFAPEFTLREGFVAMRALPLLAKGELLGVLVAFTRRPWDLSSEEEEFLEALATQGSIAIENSRLFEGLQRAKLELELAYDLTLLGWAQAVEMRDQETAGHTQRVTELTLKLARQMGLPEEDLEHLRRGAILHDVGKLGVPDAVLLKPGSLSEEEWALMRKHPTLAHQWLSGIPFLRKALAIPYAHHERWDGSGYPRGLKGEAIPLEARIFAVIDVYDALTSDRPYRPAWPREKALEYIREQSGKQFDPEVVAAFLELMHAEDSSAR
ncbi:PAS domain S-box protein [Calidithermus roseus]|uniref:Cyclic di-GMP phosphodiesterase response regulator RpfG n=1 Tax=Calidithermus roseus TaxID=1644118 RepID=A0A399ESF1_9DEIN|nr:PAS domain S-box protein [Calidithermus roseus]RIH85979.1 Cyclic di-GMP phosphodiesterase response regulator RpfG [Calidithermus roseus]